ncbi:MAG: chemotaxis protein CheA, partial [Pseudohongiellaceae bacterium]
QYAAPQVPGEQIGAASTSETAPETAPEAPEPAAGDDITDDEFEALLDALEAGKSGADATPPPEADSDSAPASASGNNDEISDDEFEALLDQLHGKGKFNADGTAASTDAESANKPPEAPEKPQVSEPAGAAATNSDEISDDEFEALLDQLHGKGQFKVEAIPDAAKPAEDTAAKAEPSADKPETPDEQPAKVEPAKVESAKKAPAPAKAEAPRAVKADPAPAAPERANAIAQDSTVRVDTKRLDDIMNMVGELVLVRNRLVRLGIELDDETLQKAVGNLNVVTADLQASVMKTRMQPIKKVFGRFPRVVRDLARSLKKDIVLELVGEETDLDKNLVDALADPLVHLVRNSVDHGIETPDVREATGKPRTGKVVLSAEQEGDHILLVIRDDGGGMDPDKLRGIAVKRGVMDQEAADRLSNAECFNLIFAPGFSTKTEISDVSGRGVGMDVVKTKITQLNGSIDIDSQMGVGTVISIKVPLTLAIMPTLMVMLGDQAFALPLV